jgi:hypothetical protein
LNLQSEVTVRTSMRAVKSSPSFPKKKRMRVDLFQGWELRRLTGELVRKFRRIDRDASPASYDEVVQDAEGNVIHECHEPLAHHRGHGTAKPGPPRDDG